MASINIGTDQTHQQMKNYEQTIAMLQHTISQLHVENASLKQRVFDLETKKDQDHLTTLSNSIKRFPTYNYDSRTGCRKELSPKRMVGRLNDLFDNLESGNDHSVEKDRSPSPAFTFGVEDRYANAKFVIKVDSLESTDENGSRSYSDVVSSKHSKGKMKDFASPQFKNKNKTGVKSKPSFLSLFRRKSDAPVNYN